MSDNGDLQIGISAQTDQASFNAAKTAVASLGGAFEKTAAEIERSKAFENAAKNFTQMAIAENNAAKAAENLAEELKTLGATDKEIAGVTLAIDKEIAAFQRAEAAAAKKAQREIEASKRANEAIGKKFADELALIQKTEEAAAKKARRDIERSEAIAKKEKERLDSRIEQDEIAARAENERRDSESDGGGTTFGRFLRRVGSEGRALPAVQIPGTPVSTDAVSKIVGLSGALVDVAGKSAIASEATDFLATKVSAQTAATLGALAPVGALVFAFGALGVALKVLADSANANAEKIKTFADAQRKTSERVSEGQTSKQVESEAAKLDTRRKEEAKTLATLQSAYAEFDKQAQNATIAGINVGNGFRNLGRIISGDEQSLADQIAASEKIIQDTTAQYNDLTGAVEDGAFAANDAAEAEIRLAEERSKNALAAADNAGQELAAQQKALAASEEQNKKRLESIEDERAVVSKQIEVLSASGVTSEEVTAKLQALKDQLGLLGKESDFIKGTALEASRAADAAKKAKDEQEKTQKEIEKILDDRVKAEQNYANKQSDLARQSGEKVADIQRQSRDKSEDIDLKYYRDTVKLADDARSKEAEAQRKFAQQEFQADIEANRKLEDLRNDAIASEQDALSSRNFLAATKIRETLDKQNKETLKEVDRGREDRARMAEIESQERYYELNEARKERTDALKQERDDNTTNLNRQLRDQRIQAGRQLNEAQIAYDRETEARRAHLAQLGGIDDAYYAQRTSMAQAAANGGSTQSGIGGTLPLNTGGLSGAGAFPAGSFGGLRPITTNNSRATTNYVTINTDSDQRIIKILTDTGVLS